jgi:hypothetical protein
MYTEHSAASDDLIHRQDGRYVVQLETLLQV